MNCRGHMAPAFYPKLANPPSGLRPRVILEAQEEDSQASAEGEKRHMWR